MEKTILIVAGNQGNRELLAQAFSPIGFRVLTASDGGAGLLQFGLTQPDLILLDLDDYETLRRMRELSNVPIITFADLDDENTRVRKLDSGADYCAARPVSIPLLQAMARALLRRNRKVNHPSVEVDMSVKWS